MLLTITTTHRPATDLGFLLYKNPSQVQTFELSFGNAYVFYPEANEHRATAALLLDIDPIGLVRGKQKGRGEGILDQYVNDRPYVASSFLSVAIAQVFGSALSGKSRERPELVDQKIPLEATVSALPCKQGEPLLRRLFEPLGYAVHCTQQLLDEKFPAWGESPYHRLTLKATCTLHDLLTHLYVLVPALDNDKHYYVDQAEVDKLLRHGEGWLSCHPERELITQRYLKHKRHLTRAALAFLTQEDNPDPDSTTVEQQNEEEAVERRISLNEQRTGAVLSVLRQSGARRIIDLGCGEGRLLQQLLECNEFDELVGVDVSYRSLEIAQSRLRLDRLPDRLKEKINLFQGALTYRDKRLAGYDAATCIEVVEHLDPPRLSAFERVIFEFAKPKTVVVTTPNIEYNVRFETLPAGKLRHKDHRFEWTREQFRQWAENVCQRHSYSVRFLPVGQADPEVGSPTQMGVFVT